MQKIVTRYSLLIIISLFAHSAFAFCPVDGPCCIFPDDEWETCSCLAAGTEVTLADGHAVAIESITEPQELMTGYSAQDVLFAAVQNPAASFSSNTITFASRNSTDGKVMYELTDTLGNVLVGTNDHPIITANRGPVPMADLVVGDSLITKTGESFVASLEVVAYEGLVHNFLLGDLQDSSALAEQDVMHQSFFANNILVGDLQLQHALGN